jgi:hypothetical protein
MPLPLCYRRRRAYALAPPRFGALPERASFSSSAFTTKSITDVSAVTQCNFSSRCSGFGIRVASCTHTTASLSAILYPAFSRHAAPGHG